MLLRLLILCCFCLAGILSACHPARGQSRVLDHHLCLRLEPGERLLTATDQMRLERTSGTLELLLAPQAEILSVEGPDAPLPYRFAEGRLVVELPPGGIDRLALAYRAIFDDPVPGTPVHTEDPTYGVAATITTAGAFLSGRSGWHPLQPGRQAAFEVEVSAPLGMLAVTDGRLLGMEERDGRTVTRWRLDRPAAALTLAAGRWQVDRTPAGETPVYTFFTPGRRELAGDYLEAAVRYLELYRQRFGPYPFGKFAVVENFFPTGYGFPSWTLLGSTVVRLPFILDTSLPHEIAHSWWGTGVDPDPSRGNWAEGLATYVADHYVKELEDPDRARQYRLKILRDYAALVPPGQDFPLSEFTSRRSAVDQAVGYGKSAMVFHMARRRIGDEAFWEGLRAVAAQRMHRQAAWSDFAASLGRAGGTDLSGFFRQWVERPGAPDLALEDVTAGRHGEGWEVRGRLVQRQQRPYDLQVPLALETVAEPVSATLSLSGRSASFRLQSRERPLRLVADPDVDLFRRLQPQEIPPTVNSIRGSDSLLVIRSAGFPADAEDAARLLLAALRREGAEVRPEAEVTATDLGDSDLLFLGLPAREALRPPLPPLLDVSGSAVTLDGERYEDPATVLFAALPHPQKEGRTAALFLPLDDEGAATAARKIPHYGKYSYLVFVDGENRAKGTWPPAASPLVHSFDP